jgi:hypothetical protein
MKIRGEIFFIEQGASPFLVSPKFQKRSALKLVGRSETL